MTSPARLTLIVRGRVQGVGFRHFVRRTALGLGLAGEVRNLPDGAVEVLAWGEEASLSALELAVRRGPPGARVLNVETRYDAGPASPPGFRVTG
jgi:acylphosphatase